MKVATTRVIAPHHAGSSLRLPLACWPRSSRASAQRRDQLEQAARGPGRAFTGATAPAKKAQRTCFYWQRRAGFSLSASWRPRLSTFASQALIAKRADQRSTSNLRGFSAAAHQGGEDAKGYSETGQARTWNRGGIRDMAASYPNRYGVRARNHMVQGQSAGNRPVVKADSLDGAGDENASERGTARTCEHRHAAGKLRV